jgi:hypothetical protein
MGIGEVLERGCQRLVVAGLPMAMEVVWIVMNRMSKMMVRENLMKIFIVITSSKG